MHSSKASQLQHKLTELNLAKFITALTFVAVQYHVHGQQLVSVLPARCNALGGIVTTLTGVESMPGNPAGISVATSTQLLATAENRFAIPGFKIAGISAAFPVATNSGLGLCMRTSGVPEYRRTGINVSYGRELSGSIRIGVSGGLDQVRIKGFPSVYQPTLVIGIQQSFNTSLTLGSGVKLILDPTESRSTNLLYTLRLGLCWQVSSIVNLFLESVKSVTGPLELIIGFEYQVHKSFAIRLGYSSIPHTIHAGFSLSIMKSLPIDISVVYHQILGISPSLGLSYHFES